MNFKILDLFCGAGGMSYGMHKNPHFKTVVALDVEEKLATTLKRNMPEVDVVVGDIRDDSIKNKIIERSLDLGVNMIIGGPPCQGYSLKGKKLGLDDPRNFLFQEYLKFVEKLQPEVFVIENVKSLLSTSKGWFKEQIISAIENLGYNVDVGVLKASDFGVPQTRERTVFIACKSKKISLPEPTTEQPITVREAIEDLAYLESNEGDFEQEYRTPAMSAYQKMMRKGSSLLHKVKCKTNFRISDNP